MKTDAENKAQWRNKYPEKWKAQKDAYKERRNKLRREQFNNLPEEEKEIERQKRGPRYIPLRQCGMSVEEAKEYIKTMSTTCEICGATKNLCVDHCHEKLIVRGRLCSTCNRALGFFKDDVTLLEAAVKYLKKDI